MILNKRLRILLYGANLWYFGEGMFGPLFAIFAERVGGDILDVSWAWAIYLIFAGILYLFFGRLSDKYEIKEKLMLWGYALNALFTFGYLFVSAPAHLFIIQAGLGLAVAMATPAWFALYSDYENRKHSGFQWGLSEGVAKIITGIAIVIGGYIVSLASFKTLFIVMGIIQVIATVIQAQILRNRHS